jgi:magnesium transporter
LAAPWLDLVDPTREEVLAALPVQVDPEVVEALVARPDAGPGARPLLEAHGTYVFGVLLAARALPDEDRFTYQEVALVATPRLLVTVRKTPRDGGPPYDPSPLQPAVDESVPVGALVHRLVDDVVDSFATSMDIVYAEIEELEDGLDDWPTSRVRGRISDLRHDLLRSRRAVSATRSAIRRVLDGRIEVGSHALFPPSVETFFADTYETLVRVTEEHDIARELIAGIRDHHQSTITESQNDIVKKLTVIASLVLVPSLIVGFYGQNFGSAFDERFWSLGVSLGLIGLSSIALLALYRWRRWI